VKPGTKAYFKSLLRSEDLRALPDDIVLVEEGWIDAMNDTDEQRRERLPGQLNAWDRLNWLPALGYITYVYGYTRVRMNEPRPQAVQLEMFA
jgi:hypothetical protein